MTGKERKKGFIATSLIYSFFLVFALLMASILAVASENRILVNAIKDDIYDNLEQKSAYLVSSLDADKNYEVGTDVSFARENWVVVNDSGKTVTLILKRALTMQELASSIGEMSEKKQEYYGECSKDGCLVRSCRNVSLSSTLGQTYCYYYNSSVYRKPSFLPTYDERNDKFGQTITSKALESWFTTHSGLSTVYKKGKLVSQSFTTNNNTISYPKTELDNGISKTQEIYVRLLKKDEVNNLITENLENKPFHLLDIVDDTKTMVYTDKVETVSVVYAAYILPVIEVEKG